MERRDFLNLLGAGVLTAAGAVVAGLTVPRFLASMPPREWPRTQALGVGNKRLQVPPVMPTVIPKEFGPPGIVPVPVPGGSISALPGTGNLMALTVDDGNSSAVVREYVAFAERTGMRLTFFVTGNRPSWAENAAAMAPLIQSGQIQVANHTWSHPSLIALDDRGVVNELKQNDDFLWNTFGVRGGPYFRPPYGNHNARVDALAASIGYTTPVMWYGTLSDSGEIARDQLIEFADKWILPEHIVIEHANFPAVTECFDHITWLIHTRAIQPVTLDDLYLRP
jgi:peptidoglycan/xylan/chitin deacetylase (PgdA/CDA1 family)